MTNDETVEALCRTFNPSEVHWRVGSTNKRAFEDGKATVRKGMPLAYIDARNVMERLDEVIGPEGWQDSYQDTPKRLFCTLQIRINGEWIHKTDGAGDTDMEGQKGGISDAFKRAAVKWGIGRYLYDCKTPWIELTDRWGLPNNFDGSVYLTSFSSKQMKTKVWKALRDAAAEEDSLKSRETWDEMTPDQQKEIWHELSSGQRSTLKKLLAETKEGE